MKKSEIDFEISFFEGLVKRQPHFIDAMILLAEAYTRKGEYSKGLELDLRLAKLCKEDPVVFYNLACSYALLGDKGRAVQMLQKAVTLGYDDWSHLAKDPDLKSLHGHPEFELLAKPV